MVSTAPIYDGWIVPDGVFDGQTLLRDHAVRVDDGKVVDLQSGQDGQRVRGIVTPGFFDLQVNGGDGVLLNTTPTRDGAAAIARAHANLGTAGCLPTLITDVPDVLDKVAAAFLSAPLPEHVLGLHIEGPHISVARKGTHNPALVRPLDQRTFDIVGRLRDRDIPVLMTVAPEAVVPGQIQALTRMGAVISLGHSDCVAADANAGFAEGASLVTHLFNGMSQMHGRAPGMVGAALCSDAYVSIICDGIHVHPDMVGLAFRSRPVPDRMILVSDAMPTVGGPDSFDLYGNRITLRGGTLLNAEGALAGAHLTMLEAVQFTVSAAGIDLQTALRAAISNPAQVMGLSGHFSLLNGAEPYVLTPDWAMQSMAGAGAAEPVIQD